MKSKTTAGLLAILFAGWGIHWFYLGKTGRGLAYLIPWIISCWTLWGPIIIGIVSIIEGITILSQSQEEFNAEYNAAYVDANRQSQHSQQNQLPHSVQQTQTPEKDDFKSKAKKLTDLKSLLDAGVLTQEEFDAEKKKVLNS